MHYEIQDAVETLYDSQDILMKRIPLGNIDEILGELAKAQKIIEEVMKEIEELNRWECVGVAEYVDAMPNRLG